MALGAWLMAGACRRAYEFFDDFNRAGPGLGANWSNEGTLDIGSNQLTSVSFAGQWAFVNQAMSSSDHFAEFDVVTSANEMFAVIRASSADSSSGGYYGGYDGTNYVIGKVGVGDIASDTGASVTGKRLRVQAVGTTISVLIDGVSVLSTTDATSSGTYVGIFIAGSGGAFDNYAASAV